jgi:hypothetical protein
VTWTHFRQYTAQNPHPAFLRQEAGTGAAGANPAGDKPEEGDKPEAAAGDKGDPADEDDEELGENGKSALKKERDARRAAELAAKKTADDLAAAKKRLEELETADLDETERKLRKLPEHENQVSTLTAALDQANAALAEERLQRAVEREAARTETRFTDTEDALAFITRSAIELDDDGKPKPSSIKRELKRILEAKPHLAAVAGDPPAEETPAAPAGSSTGTTTEADNQVKDKSRGSWRRRI